MALETIPRRDCLGLIEAAPRTSRSVQPSAIPRRDCLGLIEAGERSSAPTGPRTRIPRRDCLGLIEADSDRLLKVSGNVDSEA